MTATAISTISTISTRPARPGRPAGPARRAHPAGPAGSRRHATVAGDRAAAPDYARRRLVAAVIALLVVVAAGGAVNGVLAGLGGDPASAADGSPAAATAPTRHVAQPGDTLWSIAQRYRGEIDQSRYVDALVRLNGGASIQAGQAVLLP